MIAISSTRRSPQAPSSLDKLVCAASPKSHDLVNVQLLFFFPRPSFASLNLPSALSVSFTALPKSTILPPDTKSRCLIATRETF